LPGGKLCRGESASPDPDRGGEHGVDDQPVAEVAVVLGIDQLRDEGRPEDQRGGLGVDVEAIQTLLSLFRMENH
jgi:hypothetical protein